MKPEHIFVTVKEGEIIPYGNLKTLAETIGQGDKYHSLRRAVANHGKAEVDGFEIRKLYVVRGIKNG